MDSENYDGDDARDCPFCNTPFSANTDTCLGSALDSIASLTARLAASEAALGTEREQTAMWRSDFQALALVEKEERERAEKAEGLLQVKTIQAAIGDGIEAALAAAVADIDRMKQRNEPLLAVLLTEFGYPDDAGTCVPEFAAKVLHEQRVNLATALAKLREVEGERDRMCATIYTQGRDHAARGCTFGSLCPWCEIENVRGQLTAARESAVRGFAEWLNKQVEGRELNQSVWIRWGDNGENLVTETLTVALARYLAQVAGKEPSEMEITIIVNGQPKKVPNKDISYEEVVALAFDPVPPDVLFTVTYSMPTQTGGTLIPIPGKTIPVLNGMYFDAVDTSRA